MSQLKNDIFLNFFLTLDFFRVYLWVTKNVTYLNPTYHRGFRDKIKG